MAAAGLIFPLKTASCPGAVPAKSSEEDFVPPGQNLGLSAESGQGCNMCRMNIRKIAAIALLVLSSFAANNVAPSKAELETMYDKAFREFDGNNFSEALKQ